MDTLEKKTRIGSALEELASLKRLSVGFLQESGFSDAPNGDIRIDYGTGKRARMRKRAETSKGNAYWDKLSESLPMRAFTNSKFKKVGETVYIVEGETDCITGWNHNLWTVGVPGTTLFSKLELEDIEGAGKVHIMQEPDEAGSRFPYMVGQRLRDIGYTGEIYAVKLRNWKDLSELHCADPEQSAFMSALSGESEKTKIDIPLPVVAKGKSLAITCAADIVPEKVSWLWPGRIPYGMLTLLVGDPGAGKSFASTAIAALVTTGNPFPDDGQRREPQRVLLWNGEDSKSCTIRPRLGGVGAALENLFIIDNEIEDGKPKPFSLRSIALIHQTMEEIGNVGLVVVDPIGDLLTGLDENRNNDVRTGLRPLRDLAEQTGTAVLAIAHLNKKEAERAIYRVGGSIGFVAVARSVLLCAEDPGDESNRIIARVKGNLCRKPPAVEFRIDDEERLWWGQTRDMSAEDLLRAPVKYGGARVEAEGFLRETLANGPKPQKEIERLAKERGISTSAGGTLWRAKESLGITSSKDKGKARGWIWNLPNP